MHRVEFINAGMPFSMESNLGKRSTKYAKNGGNGLFPYCISP